MSSENLRGIRDAWIVALPSLLLCLIFDFVGGTFLGKFFDKLMVDYPIILIVLPGLMGLRGNIFGSLSSRFTTALYLGEMRASLRDRMVAENIYLSIVLSLLPILILWIVGTLKIQDIWTNFVALLILIASTIAVSLVLGYSTAIVTIIPFRRGIDPDLIAAPLITSIADVLTIPMLIAFLLLFEYREDVFILSFLILLLIMLYMSYKYRIDRRVFFEIFGTLSVLAIISSASGTLLESYSEVVYKTAILSVIYPAILDSLGNYGAIIAAKTSTKLHLGEFKSPFDSKIFFDVVSLLTTGIAISSGIYILGYSIAVWILKKSVAFFFLPFVASYILLLFFVMILSTILASVFHKFGFDPDNVSIPAITTISDLIGTAYTVAIALYITGLNPLCFCSHTGL